MKGEQRYEMDVRCQGCLARRHREITVRNQREARTRFHDFLQETLREGWEVAKDMTLSTLTRSVKPGSTVWRPGRIAGKKVKGRTLCAMCLSRVQVLSELLPFVQHEGGCDRRVYDGGDWVLVKDRECSCGLDNLLRPIGKRCDQ